VRRSTIGTKGKEFVGWAERTISVLIGADLIADLLALEDGRAAHATQEEVFTPIARVACRTEILPGLEDRLLLGRLPLMMAAVAVILQAVGCFM